MIKRFCFGNRLRSIPVNWWVLNTLLRSVEMKSQALWCLNMWTKQKSPQVLLGCLQSPFWRATPLKQTSQLQECKSGAERRLEEIKTIRLNQSRTVTWDLRWLRKKSLTSCFIRWQNCTHWRLRGFGITSSCLCTLVSPNSSNQGLLGKGSLATHDGPQGKGLPAPASWHGLYLLRTFFRSEKCKWMAQIF